MSQTGPVGQVTVREFRERDRSAVVGLWERCDLVRPWNDPQVDIDRKLAMGDGMFLVAADDDRVVGSVMAGYDGHRGWINYLAVDPDVQGGGIGRDLMGAAERCLGAAGCPKINLQIRGGNRAVAAFYERLGYTVDDVVSMGRRLIDDEDRH